MTYLFYYSIFQIYLNFVNYIVNFAFPILTLVVLNYQIYKELRKNLRHEVLLGRRHQNEQKKNALRKRDIRLTRISIIIVVIFMVCHIPRFIMNFIELAYGNLSKVKFEISEKHTKFEKIFLMVLTNQLIYLSNVKTIRKFFFQIMCVSQKKSEL